MRSVRRIAVMLVAGATFGVAAVAPASASTPTGVATAGTEKKTEFVAAVPDSDAFIGIVVGDDTAVAYFCDGGELDVWLTGAYSNGVLALESQSGATLVARRSGNQIRGSLVLPDSQTFEFEAVKAKGKAGVFRKGETIDGVTLAETWIRLANGQIRGGAGINEGITNLEPLVEEVIEEAPETTVQEAVEVVVTDLAEEAGIEPPPPLPPPVEITSPPVTAPPRDDGLPQIFFEDCFFINGTSLKNICIGIPRFLLPRRPPADALTPTPPPLEETIAGAPAEVVDPGTGEAPAEDPADEPTEPADDPVVDDAPVALGPAAVPAPEPDGFDDEACIRIDTAVTLLADEINALDEGELERVVFQSVFTHLRDRGALGGCANLPDAP